MELGYGYLLALLLLAIVGLIGICSVLAAILRFQLRGIVKRGNDNREFKRRMKEKDEMIANGDFHEWVEVLKGGPGGEMVRVCKKTGWCPSVDGFVSKEYINRYLLLKADKEEYIKYWDENLERLSKKHSLTVEELRALMVELKLINEDFNIKKALDSCEK